VQPMRARRDVSRCALVTPARSRVIATCAVAGARAGVIPLTGVAALFARRGLRHGSHYLATKGDAGFVGPIMLAKLKQFLNPLAAYRPRFETLAGPTPLPVAPRIPIEQALDATHVGMVGVSREQNVRSTAVEAMGRKHTILSWGGYIVWVIPLRKLVRLVNSCNKVTDALSRVLVTGRWVRQKPTRHRVPLNPVATDVAPRLRTYSLDIVSKVP
jgi:hypothetical protein